MKKQRQVREISEKLMKQMDLPNFKEKLVRIEEILNEGRKV